jgi:hypothetical protein
VLALRRIIHQINPADPAGLLDAGYVAGGELYAAFTRWLPGATGVDDPASLDAQVLGEVLSEFFQGLGWGSVSLERLGGAGLTLDSTDWAEAEPGMNADQPSCHLTAGLLANFMGKLAGGEVAVMEVECRSCNDARCRFLAGSGDTLQQVYEAMAGGKDYREALLE